MLCYNILMICDKQAAHKSRLPKLSNFELKEVDPTYTFENGDCLVNDANNELALESASPAATTLTLRNCLESIGFRNLTISKVITSNGHPFCDWFTKKDRLRQRLAGCKEVSTIVTNVATQ
jgi:hypothetical protein